jgi:hypothetical protein
VSYLKETYTTSDTSLPTWYRTIESSSGAGGVDLRVPENEHAGRVYWNALFADATPARARSQRPGRRDSGGLTSNGDRGGSARCALFPSPSGRCEACCVLVLPEERNALFDARCH